MVLPIIGIIILFVAWVFCNLVAWVLLILQITPDWVIWMVAAINFVLGATTMSCIAWLKEAIEDKRWEKNFAKEEERQRNEEV